MAEKIEVGVVIKGADTASKELNTLDKSADNLGTQFQSMSAAADRFTGGAVTGFKNAADGTKNFIKGLRLTKIALISTGIGAIVVLVGALVAAFMSTNENAKAMKVEMAGLGAVVERLSGFMKAAGGFISGLFTGGVTKAVSNYNKEMGKLPGTMEDAIEKAKELEQRTQSLATAQRILGVAFAKGRAKIKMFNMIAEDTTKSLEERLAAAEKAIRIENLLMDAREKAAQEELDIARERAAQSDTSEEDLDNLAQLEVNLINIRTESVELQTTLNNKLNIIKTQAAAATEAQIDKENEARDEAIAKMEEEAEANRAINEAKRSRQLTELQNLEDYLKTEEEREIDAFNKKEARLRVAAFHDAKTMEEKLELDKLLSAEREAIEKKYRDAEEAAKQATIDANAAIVQSEKDKAVAVINAQSEMRNARLEVVAAALAGMSAIQEGNLQSQLNAAKTEQQRDAIEQKFAKRKRKLAIANVLLSQGQALANAIAGAQAAAAATGPAAPVMSPILTAQMVGIVLSGFAGIKGILNQAGGDLPPLGDVDTVDTGGGGGGDLGNTRLALTPDIAGSFGAGTLELPAVQAYVLQNDIASADALQQELQNRASL